jgi:hypothetical protein
VALKTRSLCLALLQAQQAVALLERCQPFNMQRERLRLQAAWRAGEAVGPDFDHPAPPSLRDVRAGLAKVVALSTCGSWGEFLAERALEIIREAELVEALGTPGFLAAARRRYCQPHQALLDSASSLASQWIGAAAVDTRQAPTDSDRHRTDDLRDPQSLIRRIETLLGEQRLPFRVMISTNLVPVAATGSDTILVAEGRWLSAREAQRVAVHEVFAHALPRARASNLLFQVGSAGADDDEEGRAILIEQRHDLLGDERRVALAFRHLAAQALFEGGSYVEVVRLLSQRGCPIDDAVAIAARVFRGGGLGREIIYLPALLRVTSGFRALPALEQWFERGRVSLRWAQRLEDMAPHELKLSDFDPGADFEVADAHDSLHRVSSAITGQ